MSHKATVRNVQLQITEAVTLAARQVGATVKDFDTVEFVDGNTVSGRSIQLQGWRYPVVVDAEHTAHYDNYGGRWGDMAEFHRFRQAYATEAVRVIARRLGRTYVPQAAEAGHVRLALV